MDINCTIQFIKNSRGLHLNKTMFYKIFIVLPIMFLLVIISAQELGGLFVITSAVILLFIFVTDIFYLFTLVKNPLPKYKLFLRPVIFLNCIAPLFYINCLTFYDLFGLKSFLLYYIFPFFVISFAIVAIGFAVISRGIRRKSKDSYSLLCGILSGLSVLISRKTNELMAEKLSENIHFLVIAVLMLLLNCFTLSIVFFELLRYYYYTKLEKMGLVTEDILKPEK